MKRPLLLSTRTIMIFVLLSLVLVVYLQVRNHFFIALDDPTYVTENPVVRNGVTVEGIRWAFTTFHGGNWHPLTWLSHMLDVEFLGLDPGKHHLVNVLYHAATTILLFLAFHSMTGGIWQSFFVALFFGLHPLHVESVAWIAERKDVLNGFLFAASLWAYSKHVKPHGRAYYFLSVVFFSLGLLAKPMIVTLPFLLVLLDFWPLRKIKLAGSVTEIAPSFFPAVLYLKEKIPFFSLSILSSITTYFAQRQGGAVAMIYELPLGARIQNAVVSYASYVGKMFFPRSLSIYYPHPWPKTVISVWEIAGALFFLLAVSLLTGFWLRRRPYAFVGWFWYLGMMVPVIGLVQVGGQAMADRYTYLPTIGLFIIVAWGTAELIQKGYLPRMLFGALSGVVVITLIFLTNRQLKFWKNDDLLLSHAIEVTNDNWMAHYSLGNSLFNREKPREAAAHYEETIRIKPFYTEAHNKLGVAYSKLGITTKAVGIFEQAAQRNIAHAGIYNNLGIEYQKLRRTTDAEAAYKKALSLQPNYADARYNLGRLYISAGDLDSAYEQYLALRTVDEKSAKILLAMIKLKTPGK